MSAFRPPAFWSDKRANVAVIFALALVPLITAVGAAVDYSRAASAKERLDKIADSAVIEGVAAGSLVTRRFMADLGKAETEALFVNQAKLVVDAAVEPPVVAIKQTGTDREVTLTYSATVQNHFGTFLKPTTAIGGRSTSATSMPVYMDFYLLLDNSPSMGLAATPADIAKLENNTPDRCSFACHQADKPGADYYALAKQLGVTLRIDVVRQATQKLIETAKSTQTVPNQFRLATYAFSNILQEVSPLSGDFDAAKTAAARIDMITVPYHGANQDRYTDFDGMMPYLAYLPYGGNGTSSTSRKAVLFLVSDGLADEPTPGNPAGRTLKPIPLALCDQIKSRNIQIAALYTTYYPLPNNWFYVNNIQPFVSQLGPAMQNCASPGLYFEVSPSQGISEAMQALFQKAVGQARLKP